MYASLNLHWQQDKLIAALLERIDKLQSAGVRVQSQPLGFMRVALEGQENAAEGLFLHVWVPGLPIQKGGVFIHTHVFHLTSRVLKGCIRDIIYHPILDQEGTYRILTGKCAQEYCSVTEETLSKARLEVIRILDVKAGEVYDVEKGLFHTTSVNGDGVAMTLIQKSDVDNADPILAISDGVSVSEAPYKRDIIEQTFAWKIIRELLQASS